MSIASPWSREVALRLSESTHQVHAISFATDSVDSYLTAADTFQARDIEAFKQALAGVHILGPRHPSAFGYFYWARRLRTVLKRLGAEILLTLYGGTFGALAYLSGFRPYSVYVVGTDVLFGDSLKRAISRLVLIRAAAVFSNGDYLARRTQELAPTARVHGLYLGTDIEKFAPGCPPAQPITVVCLRGFTEIYNNELIVRALATIPDELSGFETVFAAAGPLLSKTRALADEILTPAQRKSVRFLGGASRDEIASLLRNAHIYVSVSRSDGTSLSLMEGLSCGLFPVLSDIAQNREWVFPEAGNGILVSVSDPAALAKALLHAVSSKELRAKAAHYNRELVLGRANSRKNMAMLASNLEAIALQSNRRESATPLA